MDSSNMLGAEVFSAGESQRCFRRGLKGDVTDRKNKLLPDCVFAFWWACPCSCYNRWGFTHAFQSWMSLVFGAYSDGAHLMSSLRWEVVTCPVLSDSTCLEFLLCLLCQRHTPISMIAQRDNICSEQWVVFLDGFYFHNYVWGRIRGHTLAHSYPHMRRMSNPQVAHPIVGEGKHRGNHTNSNSGSDCECNIPPTWSHIAYNAAHCCQRVWSSPEY